MLSFGTMLTAAWTVLLVLVAARTAGIPAVARRLRTRTFVLAAGALWAVFPLGRLLRRGDAGPAGELLGVLAMHALATLFIVAVPLVAVDAVTAFGIVLPRRAPRMRGWAVLAGLAMTAAALVQGIRAPAVVTHEVRLAALPEGLDGTTIVALSDLHLGNLLDEGWLAERVAQVEALRPDILVLLGDVLEGHGAPPERFVPGLARFTTRLGKFAVTGNHENHGGRGTATAAFAAAGFEVLRDRWAEPAPGLVIAGIDDPGRRSTAGDATGAAAAALARATLDRPPGALVLLSHAPRNAGGAAGAGVGLMLSGHTHGGQIWPFGYLVRRIYPSVAGRYEVGGMTLVVGRGTGTWGARMRLWSRGEILRILLRAGQASPGSPD